MCRSRGMSYCNSPSGNEIALCNCTFLNFPSESIVLGSKAQFCIASSITALSEKISVVQKSAVVHIFRTVSIEVNN